MLRVGFPSLRRFIGSRGVSGSHLKFQFLGSAGMMRSSWPSRPWFLLVVFGVVRAFEMELVQPIPSMGARQWAPFSMDGAQYLALAQYYDDSSYSNHVQIFKWDGGRGSFVEVQRIPSNGAAGVQPFTIAGAQFLAVANHRDDSGNFNIDSKIYKWDDASGMFEDFQNISTSGAYAWAAFSIDGVQHLAVANSFNGASHSIASKVYKWSGVGFNGSFVYLQSIETNAAQWWEAFTIDGVPHLVVANRYSSSQRSHNVDSIIYKWYSGIGKFVPEERLPTNGASGWYAFTIEGVRHLAVANSHNDASYTINSTIYKWDSARDEFEDIQAIPTLGALSWTGFVSGGVQYLAVANYYDGASYYQDSKVYRWDSGSSSFLEIQQLATVGAFGVSAFMIDGVQYLALANFFDGSSYNTYSGIYRWVTSTTTTTGTITSTSATRTSSTSSSTRTEAPSTLEATEFAFADIGAWSLAALGGYLAALAVPVLMMQQLCRAGGAAHLPTRQAEGQGWQSHPAEESSGPSHGGALPDIPPLSNTEPGRAADGSEPGSVATQPSARSPQCPTLGSPVQGRPGLPAANPANPTMPVENAMVAPPASAGLRGSDTEPAGTASNPTDATTPSAQTFGKATDTEALVGQAAVVTSQVRTIMKRSPYILAVNMLLESGNLVSTPLGRHRFGFRRWLWGVC